MFNFVNLHNFLNFSREDYLIYMYGIGKISLSREIYYKCTTILSCGGENAYTYHHVPVQYEYYYHFYPIFRIAVLVDHGDTSFILC